MDGRRRAPGRSAPYGQACQNCFKCKCKCILRPGGDGCERCHRLKKQCEPGDSLRRRAGDRNQKANARIAELEGRLEGLVSLLHERNVLDDDAAARTQQRTPIEESDHPTRASSSATVSLDSVKMNEDRDNMNDDDFGNGNDDCANDSPPGQQPLIVDSLRDATMPNMTTAAFDFSCQARLDAFRSCMLPKFPFVHFAADVAAEQLQLDRPFLFLAISCVTSASASEKRARARELKRVLSEKVFLQSEKDKNQDGSMDLLLGLMVYISWGWDHFLGRTSLSRLMMMAMSLVGEMHLDKPAPRDLHVMGPFDISSEGMNGDVSKNMTTRRFLEGQRAVLGCFVLSSVVSACFGETEPLRWTWQMEEGLAAATAHKEGPDDDVLTMQVRLQLLATKADQLRDQHHRTDPTQTAMPATPAVLEIQTLLSQLNELRTSISPILQNHNMKDVLMAHTYHAELRILEAGGRPSPAPDTPCASPSNAASTVLLPSDHLLCLWKAELAVNSAATALLALPQPSVLGASFVQWAQWTHLAHCVKVLYNLTALWEKDAGLDPAAAQAVAELPGVLDRVAEKLELAAVEAGESEPEDVFTQLSGWMRAFRNGVQSR